MQNQSPSINLFSGVHSEKINTYFQNVSRDQVDNLVSNENKDIVSTEMFFICFTNRCGSNYLAQAISSDGRLAQPGENINFNTVVNISKDRGFSSFKEYFLWLVSSLKRESNFFGCKVSPDQLFFLYKQGLFELFKPKPKFIHMKRKDVIGQAVSLFIANKTKRWTSIQDGENFVVEYNPSELISIVKSIHYQNSIFESLFDLFGINPLVISYEDFIRNPNESIQLIGDFLNIKDLKYVSENVTYTKQSNEKNDELCYRLRREFSL